MVVMGIVKNGVAVPDEETPLPEGARVRIETVADGERTLADRLANVIGIAEGLPPDLAENHDHYLHGQPKRK
jgi:hypothetical protein